MKRNTGVLCITHTGLSQKIAKKFETQISKSETPISEFVIREQTGDRENKKRDQDESMFWIRINIKKLVWLERQEKNLVTRTNQRISKTKRQPGED
jgi:hypothetical protein